MSPLRPATGERRRIRPHRRDRTVPSTGSVMPAGLTGATSAGSADARTVLVTLVGDEPLAPLVLARELDVERVICLALPVVEWRVEPLLSLLRQDGRHASAVTLTIHDVPAGQEAMARHLALGDDETVVFDLTNARGVTGFALYELAHAREIRLPDRCRLVRVDWSDRVIRSISPDRESVEPLQSSIGLPDFLAVHGKTLLGFERGRGTPSPFGRAAHRLAHAIPAARALIEASHRGAVDRPLRLRGRDAHTRLVEDLVEDGVLERRGSALFATGLRAFQFLHGRWLEEYLFEIADASGQFDDCASGLRFRWVFAGEQDAAGPGEVANEIDFAGTSAGRATIASCKTGSHDVNGPLYELLTLAERAAGRSVIPVFATTQVLDRSARRRAAALGVRILDASRLADPSVVLSMLLNGGSAPAR